MHKITITFTQVVPKRGDDIAAGGDYKTETTEIYSQSVEDLDIQGVIAAVNKPRAIAETRELKKMCGACLGGVSIPHTCEDKQ